MNSDTNTLTKRSRAMVNCPDSDLIIAFSASAYAPIQSHVVDLTAQSDDGPAVMDTDTVVVGPHTVSFRNLARLTWSAWLTDDIISAYATALCHCDLSLFIDSQVAKVWLNTPARLSPLPKNVVAPLPRFIIFNERRVHWSVIVLNHVDRTLVAYGAWNVPMATVAKLNAWLTAEPHCWPSVNRVPIVDAPTWAQGTDDCGVYVCHVIANLMNNLDPTSPNHETTAELERKRILFTLVQHSENPATHGMSLADIQAHVARLYS